MDKANRAIARFEKCFDFVIGREGGYVNHPSDRGGETKFGITKRSYSNEDIKNLTLARAREIYKKDYWDKCGCGFYPEGMDVVLFDTSVNMGVGRATEFLNKLDNRAPLSMGYAEIEEYLKIREDKYRSIVERKTSQRVFLQGWLNRLSHLRKFAGLLIK